MPAPTIHPILVEALATHETFRTLGYSADDIYLKPEPNRLFVVLRHGGKDFVVDLGEHDIGDVNKLITLWKYATAWWNAHAHLAVVKNMFEQSKIRREAVQIIAAMVLNGFPVKKSDA